jgi:formylglycine-generating enzyme required for sulfatase activity
MRNLQTGPKPALACFGLAIIGCIGVSIVACLWSYFTFGRDILGLGLETATPNATPMPPTPPPAAPTPDASGTWTRPVDGAVMVYVPAGEFLMGSSASDIDALLARCSDCTREEFAKEQPQHTVFLDGFWIDRTEVTNAQYSACMEAGACREPECWDDEDVNAPEQPVACVSWFDAQDYAAWVGGRLPTEAEWEKAARGTDGRIYPWGNSPPDCTKANFVGCAGKPLPVGSHPGGASPYGALEMAGNVPEWVADWYDKDYYSRSVFSNPTGPDSGSFRGVRGGSFLHHEWVGHCAHREGGYPISRHWIHGFRLVVTPGDR